MFPNRLRAALMGQNRLPVRLLAARRKTAAAGLSVCKMPRRPQASRIFIDLPAPVLALPGSVGILHTFQCIFSCLVVQSTPARQACPEFPIETRIRLCYFLTAQ